MSLLTHFTLDSHNVIAYNRKMFDFYIDKEFVDTKLILADGDISSHSVVLASASRKLHSMLAGQKDTQKTLMLTQFTKETMRIVLEYIYRGKVNYSILNKVDIMKAINFLEIYIKSDGCDVEELSLGEIDNSVVEVKKEEATIIEISDDESLIGTDENNKQKRKSERISPNPSNVLNKSYDFVSLCKKDLQLQHPPSLTESCSQLLQLEKNKSSVNRNPKRKKTESSINRLFSQYVNKKSKETHLDSSPQQNNQCTSKSTLQNQETQIGISQQEKNQSTSKSTLQNQETQIGISQQEKNQSTSKSTLQNQETQIGISQREKNQSTSKSTLQNQETQIGISQQEKNQSTSKSTLQNQETRIGISQQEKNQCTSKSTLQNQETQKGISEQEKNQCTSKSTLQSKKTQIGISQQKNKQSTSKSTLQKKATKKRKTNFWMNTKDNDLPKFSRKYCLVCEKKKCYFKAHIAHCHKVVVRTPTFYCKKCSTRFYFKVFHENHEKNCNKYKNDKKR